MVWKILIVVLVVAVAVGVVVQRSVTATQIHTIAEVGESNPADTWGGAVAVAGNVISAVNNELVIQDATGKAFISTCPVWYKQIDLHPGDQITVIGQVMNSGNTAPKYDIVLSAYKIFADGKVIQVRRRPGKPPWNSYRVPDRSAADASAP